jgi:hypothetical protein
MIRIEIIANHSVEENILEAMQSEGVGKYYTKYPSVYGVGSAGPRMGDAIWPEENFALVIWCEEDEAKGITRAVSAVKAHFPDEGIKLFGLPDARQPVPVPVPVPAEEDPPQTTPCQEDPPAPAQTPPQKAIRTSFEDGPEDPNAE